MIIFNADDYGYSESENRLIDEAFNSGIIKSATILPNFFLPPVKYKCQSLGIHLNLVEGKSLTQNFTLTNNEGIFFDKKTLIKRLLLSQINLLELRLEIRSQISFLFEQGFEISHADSHQSIHSVPIVYKIYTEELQKFGIRKLRNVVSKYDFFESNSYYLRRFFHYANSFLTVSRFNNISPNYVIVKAPGLGKPNISFDSSLELWEYALKYSYNKDFVYECPCHLGLSDLEVKLYNSDEFMGLLIRNNIKIGNYFDLNLI